METKYIVGQHFDSLGVPPRYVGEPKPGLAGDLGLYHDPAFARTFTDKDEANRFLHEVANFGEHGRVFELEKELAQWKEYCASGCFVWNFAGVNPELKKPIDLTGTKEAQQRAVLRWWLQVFDSQHSNIPDALCRDRHNLAAQLFPHFQFSGLWVDTQQTVITVVLNPPPKDNEQAGLCHDMEVALPFIKETPQQWGDQTLPTKQFRVMEPSLSAHGSYRIQTANGRWRLMAAWNRHGNSHLESDSLSEFIAKVCERFREVEEEDQTELR